ncbi:VanZ family protein [Erysipelothrix sp. D19-032]
MAVELNSGFLIYALIYLIVYFKLLRTKQFKEIFWSPSFLIYIFIVVDVTLLPLPLSLQSINNNFYIRSGNPIWNSVNLIPTLTLENILSRNFYLNMVMFAPFGFLINVLFIKENRYFKTLYYSFVFTVLIETLQFLLIYFTGSFRIVDVDDIIANTIGGMIGLLVYQLATFCVKKISKLVK